MSVSRLVNERHRLQCKLAEDTGGKVLKGQWHTYEVVSPQSKRPVPTLNLANDPAEVTP